MSQEIDTYLQDRRKPNGNSSSDGPTLETYIETRFNLFEKQVSAQIQVEADKLIALDLRYQQRFEIQTKHLDAAFAAQQLAMQTALAATDKAINKADLANEKRFESVNEFRQTLSDQARSFMPREESLAMHSASAEKITDLKSLLDRMMAERMGIKGGWGYAVGLIGFVVAILGLMSRFMGSN